MKTPLIVLGVIGFLSAVIAYSRYEGRKELQEAQGYAQSQGWSFSREDTQGLTAKVADILYDLNFDLHYVRTVETGERSLHLFDCSYKNREAAGKFSSYGTACLIQSVRFPSPAVPVKIFTRDWTEGMISDKVDRGASPFARKFLVQSKDPDSARRIVNESIQAVLVEHLNNPLYNPVGITTGPGGAVVLTGRTAEHERLQNLISLAREIESAIE